MAKESSIYTVMWYPRLSQYAVHKMDKDWELITTYVVYRGSTPERNSCNCFAASKPTCRHREMVKLFEKEQKVNSREAYEYDKKRWIPSPTPGGAVNE